MLFSLLKAAEYSYLVGGWKDPEVLQSVESVQAGSGAPARLGLQQEKLVSLPAVLQLYPSEIMLTFSATACCTCHLHSSGRGHPKMSVSSEITSYVTVTTFCRPSMSVNMAEARCTTSCMSFAHRSDLCPTSTMVLGSQHGTERQLELKMIRAAQQID